MDNQDFQDSVSFTILSENFNLRCNPSQKAKLQEAVSDLQARLSTLLRANPQLSAMQAVILVALDCKHDLAKFLDEATPFQKGAIKHINCIKADLKRALNE